MATPPTSAHEALILLLNAYRRPCHNLHDLRQAELEEAEALNKAANAVALPSNPPEFAAWLAALLAPDRTPESREATFDAICEYFDPDEPAMEQGSQR